MQNPQENVGKQFLAKQQATFLYLYHFSNIFYL